MSHNKERIQILSEVRRGELEIPDAITRLQTLSARPETPEQEARQDNSNRELHILRTGLETGKVIMDVRLPLTCLMPLNALGQTSPLISRLSHPTLCKSASPYLAPINWSISLKKKKANNSKYSWNKHILNP